MKKTFDQLVKEKPESFDDFDCRPGPSTLSEKYRDSILPDHLRKRREEMKAKRAAAMTRAAE